MKRCHRMPFGAEVQPDGTVRFRLWAPGAEWVALCLEDGAEGGPAEHGMHPAGAGWFELRTDRARAGTRYRYLTERGIRVPDPASRFNPQDVHGPSEVVDPGAFEWEDEDWRGRAWEETVLYELHVGAFTPQGSFGGVAERLDYLHGLGVTAIELMPIADFPGARNWGYDGVLQFAPDASYGSPADLKRLVQAAHARGLMVFLDVVYNHFGPNGNYLHVYAPQFFTDRHDTPWGDAIDFEGPASGVVRDFFVHNALYWLEEYHLDGLRLDAVNAIRDGSEPHFLAELAQSVRAGPGRERPRHLVLENPDNLSRYLVRDDLGAPRLHTAQWNDDRHDALHALLTGERDGRYTDFADDPLRHFGRALAEGCAYQGEPSAYRRMPARGEPSGALPPTAWVSYLQTHDQPGNRGFGERITALLPPPAVRAALATLLLGPSPVLLFMGEEFAAAQPFYFFCDFDAELGAAVRRGREKGYARFERFADPATRARVPDPNAAETFLACKLDWSALERAPHAEWLDFYRRLLAIRREHIVPRLRGGSGGTGAWRRLGKRALAAEWVLGDGSRLELVANLGAAPLAPVASGGGTVLYLSESLTAEALDAGRLPPWSVACLLQRAEPAAGA